MKIFRRILRIFCGICILYPSPLCAAEAIEQLHAQLHELTIAATPLLSFPLPENVFILDNTLNSLAPSQAAMKKFAAQCNVTLVQLVVAWQDLTIPALASGYDKSVGEVALASGYIDALLTAGLIKIIQRPNKPFIQEITSANYAALELPIGGGAASCGYHAVRNLKKLHDAFSGTTINAKPLQELLDLRDVNILFGYGTVPEILKLPKASSLIPGGYPRNWREDILKEEKDPSSGEVFAGSDGDWLTDAGVVYLAREQLTEGLWEIYEKGKNDYWLKKIIEKEHFSAIVHEGPHWYGIMFRQIAKNNWECLIADSKNSPRYQSDIVKAFVKMIKPELNDVVWQSLDPLQKISQADILKIERMKALAVVANILDLETIYFALGDFVPLNDSEILYIAENYSIFAEKRKVLFAQKNKGILEKQLKEFHDNLATILKNSSSYKNEKQVIEAFTKLST